MSRCERKRFLAFMLTVAMLLGVMPVDLLGGIASVKAAETVHEVNFTKLPAEGKKDTDPFTNDMMADSYYALVGSAMWWQDDVSHEAGGGLYRAESDGSEGTDPVRQRWHELPADDLV